MNCNALPLLLVATTTLVFIAASYEGRISHSRDSRVSLVTDTMQQTLTQKSSQLILLCVQ